MADYEDRLQTVETGLKHFQAETVRSYQDVVMEFAMVKGLEDTSVGRLRILKVDADEIKQNVTEIKEEVNGLHIKVDRLNTKMSGVGAQVAQLETSVDTLAVRFSQQETRLDKLEVRFDSLETRVADSCNTC